MSDQPKPAGEWTGITLSRLIQDKGYQGAADAHNAALAAEAENWRKAISAASDLSKQTFAEKDKQLAAERKRADRSAHAADTLAEQLATERDDRISWQELYEKTKEAWEAEIAKVGK